jgi:hypothetical protein
MAGLDGMGSRVAGMGMLALLMAACGERGGTGSARIRDSAGVQIVENAGVAGPDAWTVTEPAQVDIGGGGGHPAYDFNAVTNVLRLPNGRIVVPNRSTNEIRIFDSVGAHLKSVGRAGGGPGEFQSLVAAWRGPGDSLLAADILSRRLSVFDAEGTFVRSFGLGGETGLAMPTAGVMQFAIPQGWLRDGSVVGIAQGFRFNDAREGIYRDSQAVIRYSADGTTRDTIGRFPGAEMEQVQLTFRGQTMSIPQPVPLGRVTVFLVDDTHLYVARNDAWQVEVYGTDGRLGRIIRVEVPQLRITAADQAAHREEQLEALESQPETRSVPEAIKEQIVSRVKNAAYPATMPLIAGLLRDSEGNLWVQQWPRPGERAHRFTVLDSTGTAIGNVTMPERFRASAIGHGLVAGVWRDADDVEHVRIYRLQRSGGS